MKNIKVFLLFAASVLAGTFIVKAQNKKPDEVKTMIESRNYIFKAQMANPQTGTSRHLTTEYDLTIWGDSIISYLPYFGRAYVAPANPSEGGIKFTSTKFEYNPVKNEKGWEIKIRPKDAREVQQLFLRVFDNATLASRL